MNAIRSIIHRQGKNTIIVELPDDFEVETIEMILLPVEETAEVTKSEAGENLMPLQKLLLQAPSSVDD